MNFIEEFKKGQLGGNKGLPMGEGLQSIYSAINGLLRGMIYVVAAAAKGGKSTFVDAGFVIGPCIFVLENNRKYQELIDKGFTPEQIKIQYNISFIELDIIYNSYEIDRISKEFDFAAHFLNADYGIENIQLEEGVTHKGQKTVELSSNYLKGQLIDDNNNIIKVKPSVFEALKIVYETRIIPLFGQYDIEGNLMKPGLITFLEQKDNPTGIRNYLIDYAKRNGTIIYTKFKGGDGKIHQKIQCYKPNNPDKFVFIITDHLRKLVSERGFTLKQTVDKFSEYSVEMKNIFKFTFIHIIHLNRSMTDVQRIKYQDDGLYPNSDDIKETGNLAEDCDFLFTMFNPNDDRFNLSKHFGKLIKDAHNNYLYPNMRTIHLVESRHTFYPQHFRVNMYGAIKKFKQLKI